MVLLFVEWDDGSGVGMILNGCEEFCETYRIGCFVFVFGFGRSDLLSVKNQSF